MCQLPVTVIAFSALHKTPVTPGCITALGRKFDGCSTWMSPMPLKQRFALDVFMGRAGSTRNGTDFFCTTRIPVRGPYGKHGCSVDDASGGTSDDGSAMQVLIKTSPSAVTCRRLSDLAGWALQGYLQRTALTVARFALLCSRWPNRHPGDRGHACIPSIVPSPDLGCTQWHHMAGWHPG